MNKFFNQIIPFILIGIAIVAFAFGVMLLAYLFMLGALVGFVLFTISWIRNKFFPPQTRNKKNKKTRTNNRF